jgi:hypothetical protein
MGGTYSTHGKMFVRKNLKEDLEDPDVAGRILLKCILDKQGRRCTADVEWIVRC